MQDKIYYFVYPFTEYELLQNIYIILFLFVIGYFALKFITIIHNIVWKSRRR